MTSTAISPAWRGFTNARLIAATFTPMREDGSLNLDIVGKYVEQLIDDGIGGLYVGGTTGEGQALTTRERMDAVGAFIGATNGRIPVAVHVGHNSLREARTLATHAADTGAAAISAMLPTHVGPGPVETIADSLAFVASAAPDLPFIFYHMASNGSVDIVELMRHAMIRVPSVAGVKFTDPRLHELQACLEVGADHLTVFFGVDEMLAGGLIAGAHSAIGSTYNFAAPLYLRVIEALGQGDIDTATRMQATAARMIRAIVSHGSLSAQKEVMSIIGIDCGPCRLPQSALSASQRAALRDSVSELGFHDWAR